MNLSCPPLSGFSVVLSIRCVRLSGMVPAENDGATRPIMRASARKKRLSIIDASKKKPPRRTALLIYCVAVFLLAWWPWNLLLLLSLPAGGRLQPTQKIGRRDI